MVRQPTDKEYRDFNGLHCSQLWSSLSDDWRCPSCKRTKREIMIWGKRKGSNAIIYGGIGFKCGLHRHHDHGSDYGTGQPERFLRTVICNACNALDGRLKRKLNTIDAFSFSPFELSCIIKKAYPNTSIVDNDIDFDMAIYIYKSIVC